MHRKDKDGVGVDICGRLKTEKQGGETVIRACNNNGLIWKVVVRLGKNLIMGVSQ